MALSILAVILLIMCTDLFDTLGQVLLKKTVNSLHVEVNSVKKGITFVLSLLKDLRPWLTFIFSTISLCLWLFVLTQADLNFAYSIDSMRYIFITFAALVFLKERIGGLRWLGIISIVLGILLVTISNPH